MNLHLIYFKDVVIFALDFPLVSKMNFDLYNLIPLPVQHNKEKLYSFLQPKFPYLLISNSEVQFAQLLNFRHCNEYLDGQFVCFHVHTLRTSDKSTCDVALLFNRKNKIPDDCKFSTIKAEVEIWHYLNNNRWIYVLQNPTALTIFCTDKFNEDKTLLNVGILALDKHCKGYTPSFTLEPRDYNGQNVTYVIPPINILEHEYCIEISKIEPFASKELSPVSLTNVDLNELNF